MKLVFLGTGSGAPSIKRNVSSVALIFSDESKVWLWDCGEATQHQILRTSIKMSKIEKIFVSHLHGDHLFGLPGLLASRGLACGKNQRNIQIFGPEGLDSYLKDTLDISNTYIPYEIKITVIPTNTKSGVIYEDEECKVNYCEIIHSIKTYAFSLEEKKKEKHFLIEKAREYRIQPGPIYKSLKEGGTIQLPDGRVLHGKNFVINSQKRKKIIFGSDTTFSKNLVNFARDADLLIHESTFSIKEKENALCNFHSTAGMAAETAKNAKVKQLILTHISSRYNLKNKNNRVSEKDLLTEAREIFPDTLLAEDFMIYHI